MRNVSKNIFLHTIACPTFGWMMRAEQISKTPTLGEKFRMEQGREIGKRARELYPDGILIDDKNLVSASKNTKSLMDDSNVSIILEGSFLIDEFATRADILKRKGNGWHMIEVKSSMNDRPEFIDDMAYTAMVIERSGFNTSNASLMLKTYISFQKDRASLPTYTHSLIKLKTPPICIGIVISKI